MGCWISPGWSRELLVPERDGWEDVELGADGPAGVAQVLVARAGRRDDVLVCGYLVDTFCLGVKDTFGPERMRRRELRDFVRTYFAVFPAPGVRLRSTWRSTSCTARWRSRPAWASSRIRTSRRCAGSSAS